MALSSSTSRWALLARLASASGVAVEQQGACRGRQAGGHAADPLTEALRALRDQLRTVSEEVGSIKQQMTDLQSKVERLEQRHED